MRTAGAVVEGVVDKNVAFGAKQSLTLGTSVHVSLERASAAGAKGRSGVGGVALLFGKLVQREEMMEGAGQVWSQHQKQAAAGAFRRQARLVRHAARAGVDAGFNDRVLLHLPAGGL